MENYICINGKKTELTEEQMRQLGIESEKKNPFERVYMNKRYYLVSNGGKVVGEVDSYNSYDDIRFNVANYCTDKSMMEQRALHETLSRLLWRFSMEHGGDEIHHMDQWVIARTGGNIRACPFAGNCLIDCFCTKEAAEQAIKEIVEPFMREHPEFVW